MNRIIDVFPPEQQGQIRAQLAESLNMVITQKLFKKKDGSERTMVFTRIDDLPSKFVASKIAGAGSEQKYPDGMELVWDLEADNFRIFNWKTSIGITDKFDIEEDLFSV